MKQAPRQFSPSRLLGPRALAVLSCALALLAAQPILAASPRSAHTPTIELAETVRALPAPATLQSESRSTKKSRPSAQSTLFSSAHRLHILATVEILHRLLLAELRPAERHLVSACLFEPQTLLSLEQPLRTLGHRAAAPPGGLPRDRAFAIEHCLLAPPVL
ncbi:MAG: hypothetical protein ACTHN5_23370 [Phycisphaerae bacterium]